MEADHDVPIVEVGTPAGLSALRMSCLTSGTPAPHAPLLCRIQQLISTQQVEQDTGASEDHHQPELTPGSAASSTHPDVTLSTPEPRLQSPAHAEDEDWHMVTPGGSPRSTAGCVDGVNAAQALQQ